MSISSWPMRGGTRPDFLSFGLDINITMKARARNKQEGGKEQCMTVQIQCDCLAYDLTAARNAKLANSKSLAHLHKYVSIN